MSEEITQDPELLDDPEEGVGSEQDYDGEAVSSIEYDDSQFKAGDNNA